MFTLLAVMFLSGNIVVHVHEYGSEHVCETEKSAYLRDNFNEVKDRIAECKKGTIAQQLKSLRGKRNFVADSGDYKFVLTADSSEPLNKLRLSTLGLKPVLNNFTAGMAIYECNEVRKGLSVITYKKSEPIQVYSVMCS